MKVSREQMAANRERILEVAGRQFRERGYDAVTVSDVMKAAGMTHGAFYGHFKSKEELFAQALGAALAASPAPGRDLAAYARGYLSDVHCRDHSGGCATAGLAAEAIRQGPEARAELTASLQRQIEKLSAVVTTGSPSEKRRAAMASWAAMVGALVLARASADPALSAELLHETAEWIAENAGRPAAPDPARG